VNDDTLECHSVILPYEKQFLSALYRGYLDPSNHEVLGLQHPMHPVSPFTPKNAPAFLMQLVRLRNIMIKNLTKSGTHTTDAHTYTGVALKQGKKPRFVTKETLYYFYMQSDLNYTTMESFTPSLPKGITGENYAMAEIQGMTAKKQQKISAAKFDEVQELVIVELEERKLQRQEKAKCLAEKVSEKAQKVQEKISEDHEMSIAAAEHVDRKRNAYIAKLESSIEKLGKQQFRCVRMIDSTSKTESLNYLKAELENVKERKRGYEEMLIKLEQEKLASISLNPFLLPSRTPFKLFSDNCTPYSMLMNRSEVETPMLQQEPTSCDKIPYHPIPTSEDVVMVGVSRRGDHPLGIDESPTALLAVIAGCGPRSIVHRDCRMWSQEYRPSGQMQNRFCNVQNCSPIEPETRALCSSPQTVSFVDYSGSRTNRRCFMYLRIA
jgi:hypothetical protein